VRGEVPGPQPTTEHAARSDRAALRHGQVAYRGPPADAAQLPVEGAARPPDAGGIAGGVPGVDGGDAPLASDLNPWGVQGEALPMPVYVAALRDLAGRSPRLLCRLIESSAYVAQIASAQGHPEAVAELVVRRRLERRWLKSHLGPQEFTRRRRRGILRDLFGWPKTTRGVTGPQLIASSRSSPGGSGLPACDRR
jgi:hypothetical protein